MDLRDVIADLCSDEPKLTPWWVIQLIGTLPDDGMFQASVMARELHVSIHEVRGWGQSRRLLADIFDVGIAGLSFKSKKARDEAFYKRPGGGKKPTKAAGWGAFMPRRPPKKNPKEA